MFVGLCRSDGACPKWWVCDGARLVGASTHSQCSQELANVGCHVELLVLVGESFLPRGCDSFTCKMCGAGAAWVSSAAQGAEKWSRPGTRAVSAVREGDVTTLWWRYYLSPFDSSNLDVYLLFVVAREWIVPPNLSGAWHCPASTCHYTGFPYTDFAGSSWGMLVNPQKEHPKRASLQVAVVAAKTCRGVASCCIQMHCKHLASSRCLATFNLDCSSFGYFSSSVISLRLIVIKFAGG